MCGTWAPRWPTAPSASDASVKSSPMQKQARKKVSKRWPARRVVYSLSPEVSMKRRPLTRKCCGDNEPMWARRRLAGWFTLGVAASLVELVLLRVLYELLEWPQIGRASCRE